MSAGKPRVVHRAVGNEPGFSELLTEPKPLGPPPMPEERPQTVKCFVDRDAEFYHEVERLNNAVVVHTSELAINFELSVDKVAEWVATAKIIPENEIVIAALTKRRFIVILPEGLAPEVLIAAIPYEVWDEGISFQRWDPMEDAETIVLEFKTMVDLVGIPPHMYREKAVINAVSNFGLYLGTVAQPDQANLSVWTAVVATEKLEDIPSSVTMVAGSAKYPVQVRPVIWKEGRLFSEEDIPQRPRKFSKPPKPVQEEPVQNKQLEGEGSIESKEEEDDLFPMSRRVLMEICQGRDLDTLPASIRAVITGDGMATKASYGRVIENPAGDPKRQKVDEAGQGMVQTRPETPRILLGEPHRIATTITNSAAMVLEEHKLVRGINCSDKDLSEEVVLEVPQEISQGPEAGLRVEDEGPITQLIVEENLTEVFTAPQREELFPRVEQSAEGMTGADTEQAARQGAFNAPVHHEGDPLSLSQPLINLRRSTRQQKKKNADLFNQVLGRPKVLMGFMRKDKGAGPSRKKAAAQKEEKFELVKNAGDFYQIHVPYSHCKDVAIGCGLNPADVMTNIEEDNIQRNMTPNLEMEDSGNEFEQGEGGADPDANPGSDPDSEEETQSNKD